MDMQYKIEFVVGKGLPERLRFEDTGDVDDGAMFSFSENQHVYLTFDSANNDDRLYMEGLDWLGFSDASEDEGGDFYFKPRPEPYDLYGGNDKKYENASLLPGYYQLKLITSDGELFGAIHVIPKLMEIADWEKMRNEIEDTIHGLSISFQTTRSKRYTFQPEFDIPTVFQKYQIIRNELPQLQATSMSLETNPRSEIKKSYSWKRPYEKAILDQNTIKARLQHPEKMDYLYSPKRFISYNLDENMWVKNSISTLISITTDTCKSYQEYEEGVRRQEANLRYNDDYVKLIKLLNDDISVISKFRNQLIHLLYVGWMAEVDTAPNKMLPRAATMDVRYMFFQQLITKLKNNTDIQSFDARYGYYWKRTDVLYEIYAYIRLINILKELGFAPTEGWIFDESNKNYPFLNDGTNVILISDKMKINLVYNEEIWANSKGPLKPSGRHKKPDIRIDMYDLESDTFVGTIILDTKYRPLKNIAYQYEGAYTTKHADQLNEYSNFSSDVFMSDVSEKKKRIYIDNNQLRVVNQVIVLYPKASVVKLAYGHDRITPIILSPNENEDELKEFISEIIKNTYLRHLDLIGKL